MAEDKKKGLGVLIGLASGRGSDDDSDDDAEGGAKARALKEMYAAMKSGDFAAPASAFDDACAAKHEADDEEEEEGEAYGEED